MTTSGATCARCGITLPGTAASDPSSSFPFCSPRCKLVDLAKWLSGSYRIAGEPIDGLEAPPSRARDEHPDDDGSTPSA